MNNNYFLYYFSRLFCITFDYMKKNKIQVILPDALIDKFDAQAKKQSRSFSNLARLYIVEGLLKDEARLKPVKA